MLETHLCAEGYRVVSAGDGEQVLHHAEHIHLSLA